MTMSVIGILMLLLRLTHCCPTQILPDMDFVFDMADYLRSKTIYFHWPHSHNCPSNQKSDLVSLIKTRFSIKNEKAYFFHVGSSHLDSNRKCGRDLMNTDLHFVPLSNDSASMSYLKTCFQNRERINREPWLAYSESNSLKDSLDLLNQLNLDIDDDVYLGLSNNKINGFHVWEAYKIGKNAPTQSYMFASWNKTQGLLPVSQDEKWILRGNLKRYHLRFTALTEMPFLSKLELNETSGLYEIAGSFADLVNLLKDTMNFTFTVTPPPDNNWGSEDSNGSWNGMVGELKEMRADIATASLFQTKAREEAVTFSLPLQYGWSQVFIKNPSNVYNFTAYLEPLTYMSWIVIALVFCVLPLFLFFSGTNPDKSREYDLGDSYSMAWLSLIMLSYDKTPEKTSTKIAFITITICGVVLYYHWEAMLVSYLSTRKTVFPFQSLEEMYQKTDYRLALIPSTTFQDNFKRSTDPLWQSIYKERLEAHLEDYKNYPNYVSDMIHFIRNDYKTALYDSFQAISTYKEYRNCEIVATKGTYFHLPYAWAFQKHSPYHPLFNFYIRKFKEEGQWDAIMKKYSTSAPICPDLSGKPIEWPNCFTAFVALSFGMGVGMLVLVLEILKKKCLSCAPRKNKELPWPNNAHSLLQMPIPRDPVDLTNLVLYQQKIIRQLLDK